MVDDRTNEAKRMLAAIMQEAAGSLAPTDLRDLMVKEGYSLSEVQKAIQLALSHGEITLDRSLQFSAGHQLAA